MAVPPNNANIVDEFEESFQACIHALTKHDAGGTAAGLNDKDEIDLDIEQTTNKFVDLARQMESFFIQKRFLLSAMKPELLLKEENFDLRYEMTRKDDLIRRHYEKIDHWKAILSDLQQQHPPSGAGVPATGERPPGGNGGPTCLGPMAGGNGTGGGQLGAGGGTGPMAGGGNAGGPMMGGGGVLSGSHPGAMPMQMNGGMVGSPGGGPGGVIGPGMHGGMVGGPSMLGANGSPNMTGMHGMGGTTAGTGGNGPMGMNSMGMGGGGIANTMPANQMHQQHHMQLQQQMHMQQQQHMQGQQQQQIYSMPPGAGGPMNARGGGCVVGPGGNMPPNVFGAGGQGSNALQGPLAYLEKTANIDLVGMADGRR